MSTLTIMRLTTEWGGSARGLPYFSTHYFEGNTTTEAESAIAALAAFWGGIEGNLTNALNWAVSGDVEFVDEVTGDLEGLTGVNPASGAGSSGADELPWTAQGLIRWRTGIVSDGRELRGRTFVPGLTEASTDNGALTGSTVTALFNAADALVDSTTADLLVWRRPRPDLPPPALPARAGLTAVVASTSVWPQLAVLRSRRD
jgi:hypothetical protein